MTIIEQISAFAVCVFLALAAIYLSYLFVRAVIGHMNNDLDAPDLATASLFPFFVLFLLYLSYQLGLNALGKDDLSKVTLYEVILEREELAHNTWVELAVKIEHPGGDLALNIWPKLRPFRNAQQAVNYRLQVFDQKGTALIDTKRRHGLFEKRTPDREGTGETRRTLWQRLGAIGFKAPLTGDITLRISELSRPLEPLHIRLEDALKNNGRRFNGEPP